MQNELQTLIRQAGAAIASLDAPASHPELIFNEAARIVHKVSALERRAHNLRIAIERASDEFRPAHYIPEPV